MDLVPDGVLKMHMFNNLGVLDLVSLSGVSHRFHRLLKHVSEEWSNLLIEHRLEYAVENGECQLFINIYSQQGFSIELQNKCFSTACKYNYWDIITFLKFVHADRFNYNYIVFGFDKLCKYKHLDTALQFIRRNWISKENAQSFAIEHNWDELLRIINPENL